MGPGVRRWSRGYFSVASSAPAIGSRAVPDWIIGAVVDLVSRHAGTLAGALGRLRWLTALAVATAVLQALVIYGRGHFNVHLGWHRAR